MNYFEEQYFRIKAENSIAIMQWLTLAKGTAYQEGYEKFLDLLKKEKNSHWLLDFKQGQIIEMIDQRWTINEWVPQALAVLENNLKKIAVILSENIFNRVCTRVILTNIILQSNTEVAYFDTHEDAIQWLMTHQTEEEPTSL